MERLDKRVGGVRKDREARETKYRCHSTRMVNILSVEQIDEAAIDFVTAVSM